MEKTRNSANVDPRTRRLAYCALFTALGVVLGGLLSIPAMPLGVDGSFAGADIPQRGLYAVVHSNRGAFRGDPRFVLYEGTKAYA